MATGNQTNQRDDAERTERRRRIYWAMGSGTVLVALAMTLFALRLWLFEDWTKAGAFGDYIGVAGTLANAFALLAALWALSLQREELRLQRQEMAASRAAQEEQAAAQRDLVAATEALADAQKDVGVTALMAALITSQSTAQGASWTRLQLERWLAEALDKRGARMPERK